ncbi:hypothetical protein QBC46DRAFT_385688 [Diplogelasinospora grovesii]|uniref:C3H1-type domain-containing protein n=1 Tax=Diplogelasinospora grovesii TaxID=303347 RepID=A0AAN6S4L1_9PEZI|nr:hypothetical protein QBC46DRAFT_385688 [Diplogelasinospora grovesii]
MAVDIMEELAARLEAFRAQDDEKIEWIKTIHAQLTKVTQNYHDISKDLKREQLAGRFTQEEAEEWKRQFLDLQQAVERSSFVLVVIDADADAYMFKHEYYSSPDGGRKAALDLRTSIQDYLRKTMPDLVNLPIVVKAFANADGLSYVLIKSKIITSANMLWDFAKGFSQTCELFDFVLVGSGKDRADKKIKGIFKQFVENPTCRHVIFGACHDNGYVRLLEEYAVDNAVAERVTLVHSFDIGKEFASLKFKSTKMDGVFHGKPLESVKSPLSSSLLSAQVQDGRTGTSLTWAARAEAAKSVDKAKATVSLKAKDLPPGAVLVNADGQRVDAELTQPSQNGVDGWHHKTKVAGIKYCRAYHLLGGCKGGCGYSHGPLSEEEKLVYRNRLRREVCHVGVQCLDPRCFYGHSCSCKQSKCIFPAVMHSIDASTAGIRMGP